MVQAPETHMYERIREVLDGAEEPYHKFLRLFIEVLAWNKPVGLTERPLPPGAPVSRELTAKPVAQMSDLPVYMIEWPEERLPGTTARREVQRDLSQTSARHLACYVTSDGRQMAFTWANTLTDGRVLLKTLPYEVDSPARTTIEQLSRLAFSDEELGHGEPPIHQVLDKLDNTFSVEAVSSRFFEDYASVFDDLQKILLRGLPLEEQKKRGARVWAHDYALQLLNRLMFLYFIQRKGWLGGNQHFLRDFWRAYKAYKKSFGAGNDSFFEKWLKVLFFKVFNNNFDESEHRYLPEETRRVLSDAPYLNGGLFRENALDREHQANIPDAFFTQLFDQFNSDTPGFLERYNFTISESTPFDVEVAVDPEVIGTMYESLVNVTFEGLAEDDRRGLAGIFYTPRTEIDLMCRLSLVDALTNRLGAEHKPLLYDAIFAVNADEKEEADAALAGENLWPALDRELRSLTICDPACGSGSFLVGMLMVLDDLQARANKMLGKEEDAYERRKRIIGEQLYGVDVMEWAVHVAELRLWLQLVIETDLPPDMWKSDPLLPNLSFKVRQGDSLVQEIAGINFTFHKQLRGIVPRQLMEKLDKLKQDKLDFYQGNNHITEARIKEDELRLFRDILGYKKEALRRKIENHKKDIEAQQLMRKSTLPGMPEENGPSMKERRLRAELEQMEAEVSNYEDALAALSTVQDVPFVWDIGFVEIFEGDDRGFDIVIGNPPYVRQERIAPPLESEEDYVTDEWRKLKSAYKEKLQQSVGAAWPNFFAYDHAAQAPRRKLDGKSDLYIYFYLHGLSLLNERGSFCFITSNSWLDVGYGAKLQEFLLKHCHAKMILDNESKRSFSQADVNTVIVLLGPADDSTDKGLGNIARFIMFKKPFEDVIAARTFKEIEGVTDRLSKESYRVTARVQRELLEEGLEVAESDGSSKNKASGLLIEKQRYVGNKWGGKYLRAPDIFFTILEKGKGKLVRLGDIAEVRRGFTTGANEFFYLEPTGKPAPAGYLHVRNGAGWEGEIEEEFLKPVIKSPRECRSILIKPEDLRYKIFMCHKDKAALKGTAALEYIHWGEAQGYHERPSCRGRPRWWDLGRQEPFDFVILRFRHERNWTPVNITPSLLAGDIMFVGSWSNRKAVNACNAIANSTFAVFISELLGRVNLGDGLLTTYGPEILRFLSIHPSSLNPTTEKVLMQRFQLLITRDILPIYDEIHQPDRRALDDVVFDVLGLTAGEREAVYEAVVELVTARLEKARSV